MTPEAFQRIVDDAVAGLPEEFRGRLADVAILVQDRPTRADLEAAGVPRGETLYGLFSGRAVTEHSDFDVAPLPDRVVLYRAPLEQDFPAAADLRRQIRVTLLHEVGHFFGLSEEDLERLGYG